MLHNGIARMAPAAPVMTSFRRVMARMVFPIPKSYPGRSLGALARIVRSALAMAPSGAPGRLVLRKLLPVRLLQLPIQGETDRGADDDNAAQHCELMEARSENRVHDVSSHKKL